MDNTVAMLSRGPHFFRLAVAGFLLGGLAEAHAQLSSKSPFMPASAAGSAAPTSNVPLEYRGYLEIGGTRQFRLFDPEKKTYAWVLFNERNADLGVLVKEHDAEFTTLTVEHRGTVHKLPIRVGKVVAGGPVAQPMPAPVAPPANVAPAVIQTVVPNPTPADEQRRLEAVAAEVARRRALRNQAEQTVQQAQQPPPPPAPAPMQSR